MVISQPVPHQSARSAEFNRDSWPKFRRKHRPSSAECARTLVPTQSSDRMRQARLAPRAPGPHMAMMQATDPVRAGAARRRLVAAKPGASRRQRASRHLAGYAALLIICLGISVPRAPAVAAVLSGVWLMDTRVAIQIFDCGDMLCGRIIWLKAPLDPQGLVKRDKLNPIRRCGSGRCVARLSSGICVQTARTTGKAVGSTIRTTGRPTGSRWNSNPRTCFQHASIRAFRSSARRGPWSGFRWAHRQGGAEASTSTDDSPNIRRLQRPRRG